MKARTCVVGLISFQGRYLICKMPSNRGVYPGEWGIPGGGLDDDETIEEGLRREVREEVGLEIEQIRPFRFCDDRREKLMADGTKKDIYMIYLIFECEAISEKVKLNSEFEEYRWVGLDGVLRYKLNAPTRRTFEMKGAKLDKVPDYIHDEWAVHPHGRIPKGSVCYWCARYNARDSVANVMVWNTDKILLIRRDNEPARGWWALPGGYVDWDESLENAAMRELREETGIELDRVVLFKAYSMFESRNDSDGRQNLVHMFVGESTGLAEAKDEISEVGWFSLEELPENIAFGHELVIKEYFEEIKKEK